MLVALANGKAGTLKLAEGESPRWRDVFKASEDLLTASVFGRLIYLDGAVLWSILRGAVPSLPAYRFAKLRKADFWPRWEALDEGRSYVEPDILLEFELGDPSVRVDIIVEAKFGTEFAHSKDQWLNEVQTYKKLKEESGIETPEFYFLALGGIAKRRGARLEQLVSEISDENHSIRVVSAAWEDLLHSVVSAENEATGPELLILRDVIRAFSLGGYYQKLMLSSLPQVKFSDVLNSTQILSTYNLRETDD